MDNCDAFVPLESDGAGSAEAAPTEPQQVNLNLPEVEKRRKRVSIYWKRPKSHLYEYNYDYGSNYYKHVVDYLDERSGGGKPAPPKALNWAERALRTYTERREAAVRNKATDPDVELLHKIRNGINQYTVHAKSYARKISFGQISQNY